ncbi:MAG: beta-ketoacyl-ACP synthase II [Chloroflexi bacterium]|nr:beta-ketoacyl-ACP synthase II [Chloroflexota bacterium]MXY59444.1 beta-ketoacyl-ACP synthase II [Chloroflexota bacterium]MYB85144.1 beta-ketoacyl-ACP synthase II [Chloroflexota bacterium]
MTTKVYVTGVGMITPVGVDTRSTWKSLLQGKSGIAPIVAFDTEGFATTIAGESPDFDPTTYVDRKQARRLDRFAQMAVGATAQAMEQAGLDLQDGSVDATRVGSVIGSGIGGILTLSEQWAVLHEKGPDRVNPFLVPMMLADMAPGQVSILYGAKGPNYCTVTACASGADSIGIAAAMIRKGEIDIALAGGTEAPICPIAVAGFNACMALSKRNHDPEGASRPFDAERDGFVMGEGAGVLVIESEESMLRRGATPLAELAGYGASSDAFHVTQPSPNGEGGARAMVNALAEAGMEPSDISYVNAHGTSTPMNDRLETEALKTVFGDEAYKIKISSTKSMTGHLLGAAGGVEAAISVLAVADSAIPPTINLENPDPDCDLDYTAHHAQKGIVNAAMSNNLGFGGHNASLIFKRVV